MKQLRFALAKTVVMISQTSVRYRPFFIVKISIDAVFSTDRIGDNMSFIDLFGPINGPEHSILSIPVLIL